MGRNTKEHTELVNKRIYSFLLERQTCTARLKAVTCITESLLKCRSTNGDRKKKYRAQLENSHKVLCSLATDSEEYREKYKQSQKKYEQATRRNTELSDENVALYGKLRRMNNLAETSEIQKKARLLAEEDCGKLLKDKLEIVEENNKLRKELEKLKAISQNDQVSSEDD